MPHTKSVPLTKDQLEAIIEKHPTPFHLYDEKAIRANARALHEAFSWAPGFREFFAVKALPNPHILKILKEEGCGGDCSSMAELIMCERLGITGEHIMFTSNVTTADEFEKCKALGGIINVDDLTHIDFLKNSAGTPELICFRFNPGPERTGNAIIGNPAEAKYGLTRKQLFDAYAQAKTHGAKRFGLHAMVCSNELNVQYHVETARMLFTLANELNDQLGIKLEFVNVGGGIGIPYKPEQDPLDLAELGKELKALYAQAIHPSGLDGLKMYMENGRMMTGPYGYLVTRALHEKHIYKEYIGLDATMADLMRPGMYGAYHHITVMGKENAPADMTYDITGSLCENNDKFAVDRKLPKIDLGDLLVIHDTGAHGYAMGFNYNGKLRHAELLLKEDGSVQEIRRAETIEDYFRTLHWPE